MARTYTAETAPRAGINEDTQSKINGWRARGSSTVTVANATITFDLGLELRSTPTLILTDILVWNDTSAAVLNVSSGPDIIWSSKLAVGNLHLKLETYITCDKGDDLTVAITGATAPTIAIAGRLL